jgi:hypothetical protein
MQGGVGVLINKRVKQYANIDAIVQKDYFAPPVRTPNGNS